MRIAIASLIGCVILSGCSINVAQDNMGSMMGGVGIQITVINGKPSREDELRVKEYVYSKRPKVLIDSVLNRDWADGGAYTSFIIKNNTDNPAFVTDVYIATGDGDIKFSPPRGLRSSRLEISPRSSIELPVVEYDRLIEKVEGSLHGLRPRAVAMGPDFSYLYNDSLYQPIARSGIAVSQLLVIKYDSIADEHLTDAHLFWIYADNSRMP